METNYDAMTAGQKEDVTEAISDLAAMLGGETVDWQTVAATLTAIGPIAQRLARPVTNALGFAAAIAA